MQVEIGTYTAVVVDGSFRLLQSAERHLTVVNVNAETTEVKAVPYSSIASSLAASPVLSATWAGAGYANVDLDAGAQRWNGIRSLRWIRSGLYRAGFDKRQVDSLFRQLRKTGPQAHVGRCW